MNNFTATGARVYLAPKPDDSCGIYALGSEPADFLVHECYEVLGATQAAGSRATVLGAVSGQRVMLSAALDLGLSLRDVMTVGGQDLAEVHELMFERETKLTVDFQDVMGEAYANDIYLIESDQVLDESWGPHALRALVQHKTHCTFIVVGVHGLGCDEATDAGKAARERSAKLHAMGFTRYSTTPYHFMNTDYRLPALPAHLGLSAASPLETQPA